MSDDMIANKFTGGTVFKDNGGSHVTFDPNGTHITVPIGGLRQGGDVSVRIPIDGSGNVSEGVPIFRMPEPPKDPPCW